LFIAISEEHRLRVSEKVGGLKVRPRWRWEDNIKMDLTEVGIDGANWIQLATQWRAFVSKVKKLQVP
jgi:hypothetical protein